MRRLIGLLVVATAALLASLVVFAVPDAPGWNRDQAFRYLEGRQREWAAWKPAQKPGGPCISCHTGLSHMLASRALAESPSGAEPKPSDEVRQLVQAVTARVQMDPLPQTLPDEGAEVILNLLTLSLQRRDATRPPSAVETKAIAQLWEKQIGAAGGDADLRGSWSWVDAELDPFDAAHSTYFGSALALLAVSAYPDVDRGRLDATKQYLARTAARQPLHHRLAWTAFGGAARRDVESVTTEAWRAQSADGGWTSASLGPWLPHGDDAPADRGSNAYATAWTTFALVRSGVACGDPRLSRALDWLTRHQDRATGGWPSVSMNKVYPEGAIQRGFMTDAASGYATAVLLACRP